MQNTLSDGTPMLEMSGFWPKRAVGSWGKLAHIAKGLAYSLRPGRISDTLPMCLFLIREWVKAKQYDAVPDVARAAVRPDGLCGIAHDLSPEILKEAYIKGMFPWNHIGPVKWWAPRQRALLFFDDYKIDKNARRKLRNNHFSFTMDRAFTDVVRACAQPRPGTIGLTWINERIIGAYTKAHLAGDAHSLEVWDQAGNLVGGIYGYVAGRIFFTESQFYSARDASKAGFAVLNRHLQHWGFVVNDGKDHTPHLESMGFAQQSRGTLNAILACHARDEANGDRVWQIDSDLCGGDWDPATAKGRTREEVLRVIPRSNQECAA